MTRRTKRTAKARTLLIRDAATVRALRTPMRQEVLGALERLGEGSVKDMAGELGRAPAALYYHIHELTDAGLIREVGKRAAGRRKEAVYRPAAERIVIDRSASSRPFVAALADLHRATLRTAERELLSALDPKRTKKVPPDECVSLLRLTARLRPAEAKRARKRLRDLVEFLAEHDDADADAAFSFTAALVRLVPRAEGD